MAKKLKNLKVAQKLKLAFGSVVGMFGFSILLSIILTVMVVSSVRTFYAKSYVSSVTQLEMQRDVETVGKLVLLMLETEDTAKRESYAAAMDTAIQNVSDNIATLKTSLSDEQLVRNLEIKFTSWKAIVNELKVEIAGNDHKGAMAIYNGKFYSQTEGLTGALDAISAFTEKDAISKKNSSSYLALGNIILLLVAAAVCSVMCLQVIRILTRNIADPIREILRGTSNLRQGILDTEIVCDSQDELGELAADFTETCHTLHSIINDVGAILGEMAEGNFNIHAQNEAWYVGDFASLIASMRKLNHQLDGTLQQISEMSGQVTIGAEQLAESSQSLAEGATEQAGAVEELTATVESVSGIAAEGAEVASEAAEQMAKAAKEAAVSGEKVKELLQAMERISDTSKEIEKIIAAIEDIASQTNLLSLNASIEAARAGEAGRGFAVVADQIGKLATDSAQSAVNTKALIGKSLEEVERGNRITMDTVETINQIIANMEKFAQAAAGSAEGSRSQAEMLKQVEAGIEQISGVVQGNSALAQESSAVSEELSAQAESMKQVIEQFNLRG